MTRKNLLSVTDSTAVDLNDSNYINNKGANLYAPETYAQSVEYYHLAAAMGNVQAISNLGYCYLYGRDIEPDLSLAISYFKIAAKRENVDAAYKLGDIYGSNKWGLLDKELSVYYYRMAASFLVDDDWANPFTILFNESLANYPSLCFALGRELFAGENMHKDLDMSYQFLKHAETGYRKALLNGSSMYQSSYESVLEFLSSPNFDEIREEYENMYDDNYDDELEIGLPQSHWL